MNNQSSTIDEKKVKVTYDYKPQTYTWEEFKKIHKNGKNGNSR